MTHDLAPLSIDTADAAACKTLIARLPLANAPEAQQTLARLLAGLARRPPAAPAYLEVLEAAREPLAFLQGELARHYAGKPLPLLTAEAEAFGKVIALWQAMARAYAHVAQLGADVQPSQDWLARICQRCVHCAGRVIIECFRARQAAAPGAWIDLHGYFATAEEWGIDQTQVAEPLNEAGHHQSPAEAYASVLLVDLANPYGRSGQELSLICRWASRFAPLTAILPVSEPAEKRAYGIDLMLDASTRPLEHLPRSENARHFDTRQLADAFQETLAQTKSGVAPAELGLGEDCPPMTAGSLLRQLYKPWCLSASPRRFQRRGASGEARVCFGFEAIHYHVSGEEFHQPENVRMYSREDMDRIWTFRDQLDPTRLSVQASRAQLAYPLETWAVADQSVSGFRLKRAGAGARVALGQLFGLKPPDGEHFLLARVSWCMMQGDALLIGGPVLAGLPQGIAVRPAGLNVSVSERYVRAFLLPELPSLKEAASLVLPRGMFQPRRVIEAYVGGQVTLRLDETLASGLDFERVSFTRI